MENMGVATGWGLLIWGSLIAGAIVATTTRLPERLAALITAFGGGALLAAVALELVPEADAHAGTWWTAIGLVAGMLIYVGADAWLTRAEARRVLRRSIHAASAGRPMAQHVDHSKAVRGEAIAAGLFIDGVPESLALGIAIAEGGAAGALLVGILVGNVVEAYGAAQPIVAGHRSKRFAIVLLTAIGSFLFLSTVLGATLLSGGSARFIGTTQAVAGGAVLAVICVSIVPYAFGEVSSLVACAAVGGFVCGYVLT